MCLDQELAIPYDLLMQGDGRTLHRLWLCDDFEHVVHVGRLEEIDLH
jgi:hypothetical protein